MRVLAAALACLLLASNANAQGCTADVETVFHPDFVKMVRKCGHSALGNEAKTKACLLKEQYGGKSVSETCASCYGASVKCGATKCRGQCLVGDCTPKCLECIEGSSNCNAELKACAGLEKLPPACDDNEKKFNLVVNKEAAEVTNLNEEENLGCSSEQDVKTIWHPEFVATVRTCGRSNWGGYDASLSCLKEKTYGSENLSVSHTCAACYAESIKCGASTCMGSCMWGDCTTGCQQCVADNCQPQLGACARVAKLPPACPEKMSLRKSVK